MQFAGAERDLETGLGATWLPLDNLGARYYQSQTARFTSPDLPGIDQNPFDPQSWNLYSYVRNNPLRYVDPTGRKCENGYDEEKGVFCTETIGEDPWRRAEEAWQDPTLCRAFDSGGALAPAGCWVTSPCGRTPMRER